MEKLSIRSFHFRQWWWNSRRCSLNVLYTMCCHCKLKVLRLSPPTSINAPAFFAMLHRGYMENRSSAHEMFELSIYLCTFESRIPKDFAYRVVGWGSRCLGWRHETLTISSLDVENIRTPWIVHKFVEYEDEPAIE